VIDVEEQKEPLSIERIIELCEKALKDNPKNATAHHDLGVALLNQGKTDEALVHLQQAVDLAPKSVLSHYMLATAQGEKGMLDEAVGSWKRVLELDKRNTHKLNGMAHYFIGKVYGLKGMWDAAAMEFNRANKIIPDNFLIRNAIAEIHLAKGELAEAKQEWVEAAKLNPNDPRAAMNVCAIALDTGDYPLAIETGHGLVAAGQDSAPVRFNLGIANLRLGQLDEAVKHLEKAAEFEPHDLDTRLNLGEALVKKGLIDQGIKQWEQAATDHPDSPHPLYNIGATYAQNGLLSRAEEYWQKALERKPDYLPVFVARASQYSERGNWQESLAAWNQALLIEPDALLVRLNMMAIHFQQRQYEQALTLVNQAVKDNPDIQFLQAMCQLAMGQADLAMPVLRKLNQENPDVIQRNAVLLQDAAVRKQLAEV
jgi:tetratricopeptide (TPR) repeat protein